MPAYLLRLTKAEAPRQSSVRRMHDAVQRGIFFAKRSRNFTSKSTLHHHQPEHNIHSKVRAFFTRENIPPIALVVGCVALSFQIGVLYPWHEVLSEEFSELQGLSKSVHLIAAELEKKMDVVVKLEEEVKAKERKVLDHEIEILKTQQEILTISTNLSAKMDQVIALEEEVKYREKKVLEREEEILLAEKVVIQKLDILLERTKPSEPIVLVPASN